MINFSLIEKEAELIINALAKLPYSESFQLIHNLQQQYKDFQAAQAQAKQDTPTES